MTGKREREQLERHIQEAEDRAAASGHVLASWQPVAPTSLFVRAAACRRSVGKVEVGYASLVVDFARQWTGEGG